MAEKTIWLLFGIVLIVAIATVGMYFLGRGTSKFASGEETGRGEAFYRLGIDQLTLRCTKWLYGQAWDAKYLANDVLDYVPSAVLSSGCFPKPEDITKECEKPDGGGNYCTYYNHLILIDKSDGVSIFRWKNFCRMVLIARSYCKDVCGGVGFTGCMRSFLEELKSKAEAGDCTFFDEVNEREIYDTLSSKGCGG